MLAPRAVSCSGACASVPWADRLHPTAWNSTTLDEALRTAWLPQTPAGEDRCKVWAGLVLGTQTPVVVVVAAAVAW